MKVKEQHSNKFGLMLKGLMGIFTLMILTACQSKPLPIENIIHADVYHLSESNNSTTNELVASTVEPEMLETYHRHLIVSEPTDISISADLNYRLEIRTTEALLDYTLSFDLKNRTATAQSEQGSYAIPFEWVNGYLTALPLQDQFTHLMPPDFTLLMDDYEVSFGMKQSWYQQPTSEVSYELPGSIDGYETIRRTDTDFILSGHFDYNAPNSISVTISNDQGNVTNYDAASLDKLPIPEEPGDYFYELNCEWTLPDMGYHGQINYHFALIVELPVSYRMNGDTFAPGDCIAILLEHVNDLDYRIETETYSKTIGLFYYTDETELVGLIPLDSRTKPGNYTVNVYRDSTNTLLETFAYTVTEKEFETQHLTVSSSTASLKSQENREKDAAKFGDAKAYSVGEKLWQGSFLQPVQGRISTEYSVIRYVNGNTKESSRHSGLDIATEQGTPIMAANNGIVTFASDLIISGNVVVIDHGYGLFTSYVHMHKIYVEDGQEVKKGELIGEVGSTGYSTGPHLHWTVWKNGVYLNPWTFIAEDPLEAFAE